MIGSARQKMRQKKIGEGAFATVCLSVQKSGELTNDALENVAIKRLKRQSSVEDAELFDKEADVLQRISHK